MNPIEKITDSSFTESSKGLMTLFCIGLVHLVIGVELTDAKISIPWFPTVNFEHPDHLVYLYWALVVYSAYRYTLHHALLLRELNFTKLHESLLKPRGEKFIRKYILPDQVHYKISVESKDQEVTISIQGFTWDGPQHDPKQINVFYFDYVCSSDYQFSYIEASEDEDYSMDNNCIKQEENKWGFEVYADETGSQTVFVTRNIPWLTYRIPLLILVFPSYCKAVISQKHIFDLLTPLILNAMLGIAWVVYA